jgi:exopolyphosphatase/guanosine-5'-triphosphate,3'-diphosphate pyrophosphatase
MRAAVIDVGSNSIKLLVADRRPDGLLVETASRTLEARIGTGLGAENPRLGEEGIARGVAAVGNLVAEARGHNADTVVVVATSAVRDASNGEDFRSQVKTATGLDVRILTGIEEADLIGRGLTTDPALTGLRNFDVFDLGGGSLECLSFVDRRVERAISLKLGCVRLTERFVSSPSSPLSEADSRHVGAHVKAVLSKSGFQLPVPQGYAVVGTGGTLTTVRAIIAAGKGIALEKADPTIRTSTISEVLAWVGPLNLAARREIPGLPPGRADVFPAALVTLLALADLGGIEAFRHSLRNLRWGVASEILG